MGEVTTSTIEVTLSEIPDALAYELVLRDAEGEETVIAITTEDFTDGRLTYTLRDLPGNTDFEIDLRYLDEEGTKVATTLSVSTGTGS